MSGTRPLPSVEPGMVVELVAIQGNGPAALRLAELGLNPHTSITILKSAPGQPLILGVRGTHLAIDRSVAECLQVRVLGEARRKAWGRGWRRRWHSRGRRRRWEKGRQDDEP